MLGTWARPTASLPCLIGEGGATGDLGTRYTPGLGQCTGHSLSDPAGSDAARVGGDDRSEACEGRPVRRPRSGREVKGLSRAAEEGLATPPDTRAQVQPHPFLAPVRTIAARLLTPASSDGSKGWSDFPLTHVWHRPSEPLWANCPCARGTGRPRCGQVILPGPVPFCRQRLFPTKREKSEARCWAGSSATCRQLREQG